MLLPLLLIVLAASAATIIAYGTHPGLAQYAHGLDLIMASRRIEWPLITLCLLLCIALLGLVISGKRRAWWLIGLGPILALFVHRFAPWNEHRLFVLESPNFMPPEQLAAMHEDWWIVGVVFQDQAYALPYWALYSTPVVFITDYDKRMILLWSAHANRAVACSITRELKPRDIEIVSSPDNTLLLLDRRLGQFIVALTGLTVTGQKPVGFGQPIATVKTTWGAWRKIHPNTRLLQGYLLSEAPAVPILPQPPARAVEGLAWQTLVAVVDTSPPAAIVSDSIGARPLNTAVASTRLLLLRDPLTHRLRAFDRNVKEDLFPTFAAKLNRRMPEAILIDSDSNSSWTRDGKAIDGPLKGSGLKELPVEEGLYWGVMKHWQPQLNLLK